MKRGKLCFHLHPSLYLLLNIIIECQMTLYFLFPSSDIICKPCTSKRESLLCVVIYLLYLFFPDVIISFVWRIFLSQSLRRPQISKYFSLVFFNQNFFGLCHMAHMILVPRPEIEPTAPAVETLKCWVLTTELPGKSVYLCLMQFGCFQPRFFKNSCFSSVLFLFFWDSSGINVGPIVTVPKVS